MAVEAPYGSWKSPLSSDIVSGASKAWAGMCMDKTQPDAITWAEMRPSEGGRTIVMSCNMLEDNTATQWTKHDDFSAYNKVHEYGGASFACHKGNLYFSNQSDQKIYRQRGADSTPEPVTDGPEGYYRYADFNFVANSLICVREDHGPVKQGQAKDPDNTIIALDLSTKKETVLCSGYDFYAYPRVSPDGSKLAWMQWKFPNMPWDDTEIWLADFYVNDGLVSLTNHRQVCGEVGVNYMEPRWTSDGKLCFISDKTGWWNLYLVENLDTLQCKNVCPMDVEIGSPCWKFGHLSYAPHPSNPDVIAVLYGGKPALLTVSSVQLQSIDIGDMQCSEVLFGQEGKYLVLVCFGSNVPCTVYRYDFNSNKLNSVYQLSDLPVEDGYFSRPEEITFPTDDGKAVAHAYYYPPKNKDYIGTKGTLPPCLVCLHGGPTASASKALSLNKQYYTSRGFAVLDVNYRGSTGYGTAFRNALRLKWGEYDIQDACAGALYLAEKGLVDGQKLTITGGSAGR